MYELARFDLALKDRYRRGTLQRYPHRVKAVEELGFNWGLKKGNFERWLEKLRSYKMKYGHCEVHLSDDKELYNWVAGIRARHRKHTSGQMVISEAHQANYEKKIAKIGEIVGGKEQLSEWIKPMLRGRGRQRIEEIRIHRDKTGHCVHPDITVRCWVKKIRARYDRKKRGRLYPTETMSEDLVKNLNQIGFCWTARCTCEGAPKDQYVSDNESSSARDEETDDAGGWETGVEDGSQHNECSPRKKDKRTKRQRLASQRHSDVAWRKWMKKLKEYKVQNGSSLVKRADDVKLHDWLRATWISYRRFQRGKETKCNKDEDEGAETDYPQTDAEDDWAGSSKILIKVRMTETRASELEKVMSDEIETAHFTSEEPKPTFMAMFKKWSDHKQKEGNCKHPDQRVWRWVTKCRMRRRKQLKLLEHPNTLGEEGKTEEKEGSAPREGEDAEELPKGKRKRKRYVQPPLTQEQFELLNNAGLCWCRSCICDDPMKKAALSTEKQRVKLGNISFDERLALFQEHRKKTGHCIHPDSTMRGWFGNIKGRRRATLEKRARDAEGKGIGTRDKEEDVEGGVDELKKEITSAEKLPPAGLFKPLSDEIMAKIEDLDACWGYGCNCPSRYSQPKQNVRAKVDHRARKKDRTPMDDSHSVVKVTSDRPFNDMLTFFLVNRSVNGRCYSYYPQVQRWYENIRKDWRRGKGALTDMQISALEGSGICSKRCLCRGKKIENLKLAQRTPSSQEQEKVGELPITKTVADLDPSELEKLAKEVVEKTRKRDCWSSDECSSDESLLDNNFSGDELSSDESSLSAQGEMDDEGNEEKDNAERGGETFRKKSNAACDSSEMV
mmetsp:Transcript_48065/g.145146  ORF Transcript_48065/g.145146 Transcript_48065/m.145146 type:complete len:841 (-) Transcript_48065:1171-3693(-)